MFHLIRSFAYVFIMLTQRYIPKPSIINNARYRTNLPTDPIPLSLQRTEMQICAIYTHNYFVSRHISTRGNNKILLSPSPHITTLKTHFPSSLVAPFTNSEQINHPFSNYINTKLTLTHTHHHLFNFTHIRTTLSALDIWTYTAGWREQLGGGPQAGRSESSPH